MGRILAGFGDSKIEKVSLLYAEKEYGMCYSIAGASSGKKKKRKSPASLVLLLLYGGCAPANTCLFSAFTVSQQKCALVLAPIKNHLPLRVSNSSLKSSEVPFWF